MSLESISGSNYNDNVKYVQKVNAETINRQGPDMASINISEVPAITNPTGNEQNKGQNEYTASKQQIKDAISKANSMMKSRRTRCEFNYHEETKRVSIKVFDNETEEVIREIPPEEALDMVERIWELAGLLIDERR